MFIGFYDDEGDHDFVQFERAGLPWDVAKALLLAKLAVYEDDTCLDCKRDAKEEYDLLQKALPGKFEANVDGIDYLILCEDQAITKEDENGPSRTEPAVSAVRR